MKLTHSCIISKDVKRLSEFYENILQIKGQYHGDDYSEFQMGQFKLSIFNFDSHESLNPGSARPTSNKSVIFEFNVEDVDYEYKRLSELNIDWVKPPTVYPWGAKSFYFRDLDGNLISFYTLLSQD